MIDTHLHVVDFLQKALAPEDLARSLSAGVTERAVVFGLPVKKKWALTEPLRPTYYLDDNAPCGGYSLTDQLVVDLVQGLDEDVRARVAPLICGFDPTDLLAVDHVETMMARFDGWRGLGEVLLRHDDLTELTYGENARAGHPALDGLLEICAARGWPLLVHQDASSAGWSEGREYVDEMVSMLGDHPRVPVVWAHAGVSRRVHPHDHTALLAGLLEAHPNLHVDLSWVVFDQVVPDGEPSSSWVRLLSRWPERFLLGSDVFGSVDDQPALMSRWQVVTDRLAARDRALIEDGNAVRLWFPASTGAL